MMHLLRWPLLLVFMAAAPQVSQCKPSMPEKRFTRYQQIPMGAKSTANSLGYTEASWNGFSLGLEQSNYDRFGSETKSAIDVLMDGNSQEKWDCWVNHYRGYSWSELDSEGVQDDFKDLGWNSASWDGREEEPESNDKTWDSLESTEQKAAENICYQDWSWNGGSIPSNVNGSSLACFSSANKVQVREKGLVSVDKLKIGDYVMASNGDFSRIYSFSHYDALMVLEYLQIYVSGQQKPLEITGEHMMLVNNKMQRASEVNVGDILNGQMVEKIASIHRQGAYAPVTESGDIIVEGVLASCFVAILDHAAIDQHSATHAFLSPLRLLCAVDFGICKDETYTNGYSNWIYHMMVTLQFINGTCGPFLQTVVSGAAWPLLAAVYMLVEILMRPLLLWVASAGAVFYWRRTNKRSHVKAL